MNTITITYTIIGIAFLLISIATVFGWVKVYRSAVHKAVSELQLKASEIQANINEALQSEITLMKDKITELERENIQLKQQLGFVRKALSKKGLAITIDGELVNVSIDQSAVVHATARIEEASR